MTNMKYVAFDVHTATIVVVVLDRNGKLMSQAVIKTEATGVCDFLRGISGEVHLTFEEGTRAQWLYELTRPLIRLTPNRPPTKGATPESLKSGTAAGWFSPNTIPNSRTTING